MKLYLKFEIKKITIPGKKLFRIKLQKKKKYLYFRIREGTKSGLATNPSKRHRERLNSELEIVATLLPYEQNVISRLISKFKFRSLSIKLSNN